MRLRRSLIILVPLLTSLAAYAQQVPRPAGEFAIKMPNGQITLLSQYAGKIVVLAFISTTCPHCQHTTQVLSGLQSEYGPRGVQFLAAAFNPDAAILVPNFIRDFKPTFPVGSADRDSVLEYEQASLAKPNFVPELIFIDRGRVIRAQHNGGDDFFKEQEKSIREMLDTLLKEPVKSAHNTHKSGS
ncbi:MAG TPA: TlpA disulfide reductase family protein [Bryobacteraceae bacterium]|jgi:thiol-disulfide isomerase/thioredoxin|nr:TlpA disulfide reductase family protein [Bryobacteraceae bacterium]